MTKEEMQVLRALEVGLAHAETSVAAEDDPVGLRICKREVQQIKDAIEVVKRWETKA